MIKIKNLTRIRRIRGIKYYILSLFLVFVLASCSSKEEESKVLGKKTYEPNLKKRMEKQFKEEGGIFTTGKKNSNTGNTFEFATSNVLWRATLKTLNFMPLQSANYSGGILITDWYSNDINSKESLKIEVRFFSNELKSDSMEVTSFKKICNNANNCEIKKGNKNFNFEIKNNILNEARKISLEETKK